MILFAPNGSQHSVVVVDGHGYSSAVSTALAWVLPHKNRPSPKNSEMLVADSRMRDFSQQQALIQPL